MENLDNILVEDKTNTLYNNKKIFFLSLSILILLLIIISIILLFSKSQENKIESDEKIQDGKIKYNSFETLFTDDEFIKPKINLNAKFELIKVKNGITCLLINDPYSSYSHININIPNGSFTETIPGITHLGEHMIFGGSEKYPFLYPQYDPLISGVVGVLENAHTRGMKQVYYITVPNNFLFDEAIDRYPCRFTYIEDKVEESVGEA